MVRIGGMSYAIDAQKPIGRRISDMRLISDGQPIEPGKSYVVAGWASINPDVEGPPVYDVVERHIAREKVVRVKPNRNIRVAS
jgi:sulfur-oxidizing protein SoxB